MGRGREDCHAVLRALDRVYPPILWAIQGFLGGQAARRSQIPTPGFSPREVEPASQVVVGHQQYQQAINGDPQFRRAFVEVFRRRAFLFLGSGILEDYFLNLFSEIVYNYGTGYYPHFALLDASLRANYDVRFLQMRLGIRPVFYDSKDNHSAVGEALRMLQATVRPDLSGEPTATSARGHLKRRSYVLNSTGAGQPVEVSLTNAPLPEELGDNRCVAFSTGRVNNRPHLGTSGGPYLSRRNLSKDADNWEPLGDAKPCFAYRYRNEPIFAVAARGETTDAQKTSYVEEDLRDLGIIPDAVAVALREIDRSGFTSVSMSAIASGVAARRLWHPIHPFAQTLRGIRRFLEEPGRQHLRHIELCLPDPRIWGHIGSERIPVLEPLTVDWLQFPVEIHDAEGKVDTFSLLLRDGATVGTLLKECGLSNENVQTSLRVILQPPPTAGQQPEYASDMVLAPTMTMCVLPARIAE